MHSRRCYKQMLAVSAVVARAHSTFSTSVQINMGRAMEKSSCCVQLKMKFCAFFLMAFLIESLTGTQNCPQNCSSRQCVKITDCVAGAVMDTCGCCAECGRREGESCIDEKVSANYGNTTVLLGDSFCGDHLQCEVLQEEDTKDRKNRAVCFCKDKEVVCGSDGQTYNNLCQLMEHAAVESSKLRVHSWGACKTAPQIFDGPRDSYLELGAEFSMDCGVRGFPTPSITWQRAAGDGSVSILPGYSEDVAVQTRGGPSAVMLTSWVQVRAVQPQHAGLYTCIAVNTLGSANKSATLGVYAPTPV